MTKWKPIETAPKDGTSILAWGDNWSEPEKCIYVNERWYIVNVLDDMGLVNPTHWIPLPEPPEETEK